MDPSIGRQMFERTVDPNEGHEGARGEIAPLPLNLVALIISFVRSWCYHQPLLLS